MTGNCGQLDRGRNTADVSPSLPVEDDMTFRAFVFTASIIVFGMGVCGCDRQAVQGDRYCKQKCISNLKTMAAAIRQYQSAHGGTFPVSLQDLSIDQEVELNVFHCPATGDAAKWSEANRVRDYGMINANTSYVYRLLTPGVDGQDQLLVADRANNHVGGGHVLSVDGSVKWVKEPELQRILNSSSKQ